MTAVPPSLALKCSKSIIRVGVSSQFAMRLNISCWQAVSLLLDKFAQVTNSTTLLELAKSNLQSKDILSTFIHWWRVHFADCCFLLAFCFEIQDRGIDQKRQTDSSRGAGPWPPALVGHVHQDFESLLQKLQAETDEDKSQEFCKSLVQFLGMQVHLGILDGNMQAKSKNNLYTELMPKKPTSL